jgi:hypothetical protein
MAASGRLNNRLRDNFSIKQHCPCLNSDIFRIIELRHLRAMGTAMDFHWSFSHPIGPKSTGANLTEPNLFGLPPGTIQAFTPNGFQRSLRFHSWLLFLRKLLHPLRFSRKLSFLLDFPTLHVRSCSLVPRQTHRKWTCLGSESLPGG